MKRANPQRSLRQTGQGHRAYHGIQRLFLLDVLRDRSSRPVFVWALSTLLFGTLAYHWLEGWSYLDALYFCVISLATIGYGDLTPTTPFARAFTIVYVINGIVILLAFFDSVRDVRMQRLEALLPESDSEGAPAENREAE